MLFFILAVNILNSGHVEKRYHKEKKAFSSMSFQDIGITREKVRDFFESDEPRAKFFKYSIIFGIFIFIAALVMNLVFIFKGESIDFGERAGKKPVPWGVTDLIRAGIIIIFLGYAIGILEALVFRAFNIDMGLRLRMMLDTFFVDVAVVIVILYIVLVKYKGDLQTLGLRCSFFFRDRKSVV